MGECFFWYQLTWVVLDKIHRAIKWLCVVHCFGRNKKVYEPPRYMTAAEAAQQLMTVVANRRAAGSRDFGNTVHVVVSSIFSCSALFHLVCHVLVYLPAESAVSAHVDSFWCLFYP